jgi:putative DNA primase/helicase
VASTNHLYYVTGTTPTVLADGSVPVLLVDSECSALAALQLWKDDRLSILPIGLGGPWGWRKSAFREDPDGGETKVEKGPVAGLKENIAKEGRRIIIAFGSDATKDKDAKSARAAAVKFLKKQKAIVSIIEVPDGPCESRQDLGQWIAAAGADVVAEAVQKLLDATSTSNSALTRGYVETEDGSFSINQEGNATFLASPIKVTACTREQEGDNWGRLIEICTPDNRIEKVIIPMVELAAGGTPLAQVLLTLGVRVNPSNAAKDRLAMWIQFQTAESIFVTSRVGWHGKSYVLPGQTIAPPGTDFVLYHGGRVEHHYRQKGTLEQWIEQIGRLCIGNSRLVFAVALAFAGFLLRIIEQESGGFHFQGLSSIGKTTLLRVAGSVLGGGEKGFIRSWRATSNGLEAVAELHNDSLLCLDELGQVAPEEAGRAAYMLANGTGKTRMSKAIQVRQSLDWRLVFLSTGETSLADHMMSVGRQVHAGQEVRIISIAADAGKGMGSFEDLHGVESADQFANQLNSAALAYYGTPSIAFLHRLVLERDKVAEAAKGFMEKFLKTHVPERASGEVFRAARRFSLVAFAGEYASSLGITGWLEGEATRAAVTCYKSWLDQRGSMGAGDTEAAIAQVRHFLTLHGGSRFETICPDDDSKVERTSARDRVGFRQELADEESSSGSQAENPGEDSEDGAYVYYVLPEAFRRELAKGFDAATVAKALRERGHLDTESGRLTYQKRLPGMGRQRVYCILPSIFNE